MTILAGAGKVDITPPLGGCLAGSVKEIRSETITDQLYVSALVVDDGTTEAAIISIDVCTFPTSSFREEVLPEIKRMTGIEKDYITLSATHTHAGPVLRTGIQKFGSTDEAYKNILIKKIATAVRMAQQKKQPVHIAAGRGESSQYNSNRRLTRKSDGSIIMSFGCSGDLSRFEQKGVVDNEMVVVKIDNDQGQPIAIIVNYADHNNAIGADIHQTISSDFAGVMRDYLERIYEPPPVILFLAGCCGNVTWNRVGDPRKHSNPGFPPLYKRIGMSLAGDVMRIMGNMYEYQPVECISVMHKSLTISERPYCEYDTEADGTFGDPDSEKTRLFINAYKEDQEKYGYLPLEKVELDICGLALGSSIALVTNPNELFTEYGLQIKEASPFHFTLVAELTNGYEGYVPTLKAFAEGGYEVRKFKSSTRLDRNAGEEIRNVSIELLKRLKQLEQGGL